MEAPPPAPPPAPPRPPWAAALALAAGAVAIALPWLPDAAPGWSALTGAAQERVDGSLERNTVTFLSLSGIKSIIASIEGSAVGVGFHLEIGDLVQPAYDYVDFVWHAFLYALALLGLYKLAMETGILELGFPLLGAGLVLWGLGTLGMARRALLRRLGRRLFVLGAAVAFVLPLSLLLTHGVSQGYLEPLRERAAQRIEEAGEPLERAADRMRRLRDELSILQPGRSVDTLQREARAAAAEVSQAIWDRLQAFLAYVLILGVELLLLPFLSAFVIYRLLSAAARGVDPVRERGEGGDA